MATTDDVEYMILPRMSALSEVVWSPGNGKYWNNFSERLLSLIEMYVALRLDYATHTFEEK